MMGSSTTRFMPAAKLISTSPKRKRRALACDSPHDVSSFRAEVIYAPLPAGRSTRLIHTQCRH